MSSYNPATVYSPVNYATNPYSGNPYVPVPNPFAGNPYMTQQPMQQPNGQQQDYLQGQGQQLMRAQYPALKGRAVTGMEEARAAQIDFDGTVHMFTDFANGKIYTKQLSNDGIVVFNTYDMQKVVPAPTPTLAPTPAPISPTPAPAQTQSQDINAVVSLMQDRISGLENTVNSYKEMFLNGAQSTTNRANANGKSKPNANDTAGGGK